MKQPLVTIAIPAFKGDFIQKTIKSALSQTYQNIEVLIVDDCSPYNIKEKTALFDDPRLTYIRNPENIGKTDPSLNWNRCLSLAHGEFICILCDDDMYGATYLEEMLALAERYPACHAFRSAVSEVNEQDEVIDYYPLAPEYESADEYIWHLHSGNNRQTLSEWTLRVSALREMGGYVNSPIAWGADCMTIFRLAAKGGVATSPHRLMQFRLSTQNITGCKSSFIPQKILGWQKQCSLARNIIETGTYPNKEIILRVIERDRKQWTKNLAKQASLSELITMYRQKDKYSFSLRLLFKALWHKL